MAFAWASWQAHDTGTHPVVRSVSTFSNKNWLAMSKLCINHCRCSACRTFSTSVGVPIVPVHRIYLNLTEVEMVVPARGDWMMIRVDRTQVFTGDSEPAIVGPLLIKQAPDVCLCAPPCYHKLQMSFDCRTLCKMILCIPVTHFWKERLALVLRKRHRPH